MACLGIVERRLVAVACNPLRHFLARDEAHLVVTPLFLGFPLSLLEERGATRQHCRPQTSCTVVRIEAMPRRQLTYLTGGPTHAVPQLTGTFQTQRRLQRRHVAGPAEQGLAAV